MNGTARRNILIAALAASALGAPGPAIAADLATRPFIAAPGAGYVVGSPWYRGGNHWRGHHDVRWDLHPRYAFVTPGWRAPWYYSPRGYAEPYRPRVIVPVPVAPGHFGARETWSAQFYAYCAEKYRSFDAETGLYTTFSGDRRTCR